MPDLQSIQTTLQSGHYAFDGWLATVPETPIFARAVNMATVTYPLTAITYDDPDGGVGVFGDVPEDAEIIVYVGSSSVIRGRLRVAYGGADATTIQVNEVSAARINIQDNDRFVVLDSWRLRDKLVAANEDFDKDSRRVYTDEGEEAAPTPITGCGIAGYVNATTGLLTATFDASESYTVDVDNTGGFTYLWDVADGTITVGADTDVSITVTFPANVTSFRWVTLTLTDADTGKSSIRKIPVWSFDGTNTTPIRVKAYSATLDRLGGTSATFELAADCDVDSLPEGALVYYFEREDYDGTEVSYGNEVSGRSTVKFVGYLRRETIRITPETDTVSFDAISPLQVLAELAGFSQALIDDNTPTNWQEDEFVSIRKLVWYLGHYHTSITILHDLMFDLALDKQYLEFFVQESVLLEQIRELARAVRAVFTCDRTGRFYFGQNLQRSSSGLRALVDTALAMTVRDLSEIPSLVYEHRLQYNAVEGQAFTTIGNPMLSISHAAPAEAPDKSTEERLIEGTQTTLNEVTGFVIAELNSTYNGLPVPKGMEIKPHTSYDVIDPAYPQWITLTLASSTNRRARFFSGDRFIVQRVQIEANAETGTKDITWTIDHETTGAAGTTVEIEVSDTPYFPPITFPPFEIDSTGLNGLGLATNELAAFTSSDDLHLLRNFRSGSPTETIIDLTALSGWGGGTLQDFTYDAASTSSSVNGVITTSSAIQRIDDIDGARTLSTAVALPASTSIKTTQFERGDPDWGIVVYYIHGTGTRAKYTTDGGLNWTDSAGLPSQWDTNAGTSVTPGLWLSPSGNGTAYTTAFTNTTTGAALTTSLYRTTDYGANWSLVSLFSIDPLDLTAVCLVAGFTDQSTFYYARSNGGVASYDPRLYRNGSDISPTISADSYAPEFRNRAFSVADDDASIGVLCGVTDYGGSGNHALFHGVNLRGTPSWTLVENTSSARRVYAVNRNIQYVLGLAGYLKLIVNTGGVLSLQNKSITSSGEVVGICGL